MTANRGIQRNPDVVFSALWAIRFFVLIVAHVLPDLPWFGFWVSMSFFPLEGVARYRSTGLRDTMSEIITWVLRLLSKHNKPLRGWNNLALIIALLEAAMVWKIAVHLGNTPPLFANLLAGSLIVMLHDHWLRPDLHG